MSAIKIAASIAKTFEGLRLTPYFCPAGVATIGFGSTRYPDGRKVKITDEPITESIAIALLLNELRKCEQGVLRYCPNLSGNENRLAAITDFVYNLGIGRLQCSTLRRRINQENWPEVRRELMKWVRGGGKILPGLVARRRVEAGLV